MRYTFTHAIHFKDNTETRPYRSTRWWKTVRGALTAAEAHAMSMQQYYDRSKIREHALAVMDEQGKFITNMAA